MIAEFHFGSRVLGEALTESGARAVVESLDRVDEGRMRAILWVHGGEYGTFEELAADDDEVVSVRQLASVDGGRLYRVEFTAETGETLVYSAAVDTDAVIVEGESEGDGWWFRSRFPDRATFSEWLRRVEDEDSTPVEVQALYSQENPMTGTGRYGLTGPQREALVTALEAGYFEVPRQASLADVAADLGVSSQATSERLRRGVGSVLAECLRDDLPNGDVDEE